MSSNSTQDLSEEDMEILKHFDLLAQMPVLEDLDVIEHLEEKGEENDS